MEAQTRYWDERWQRQDRPNRWQQHRADVVFDLAKGLGLNRPSSLDLGCGTGFTTQMLSELGPAEGIDLSAEAIAIAASTYPNARFRSGDLYELDLAPEPVDLIVCQEVIPHVADQRRLMQLIAGALKPRGHLIITAANRFVMSRLTGEDGGPIGYGPLDPKEHLKHWLSLRQLKALMRPDFEILKTLSIMPLGHRGVLRLINSHKVNELVGRMITPERLETLKGNMGWGYTLIAVGRKRH